MVGDGKVGTDAALLLRCWEDEVLAEDRERVEFPASRPQKAKPLSLCLPSPRAACQKGTTNTLRLGSETKPKASLRVALALVIKHLNKPEPYSSREHSSKAAA